MKPQANDQTRFYAILRTENNLQRMGETGAGITAFKDEKDRLECLIHGVPNERMISRFRRNGRNADGSLRLDAGRKKSGPRKKQGSERRIGVDPAAAAPLLDSIAAKSRSGSRWR